MSGHLRSGPVQLATTAISSSTCVVGDSVRKSFAGVTFAMNSLPCSRAAGLPFRVGRHDDGIEERSADETARSEECEAGDHERYREVLVQVQWQDRETRSLKGPPKEPAYALGEEKSGGKGDRCQGVVRR